MEEQFEVVHIYPSTPIFFKVALLLTVAYPWVCLITAARHAHRPNIGMWNGGVPALVAALPLFFNAPVVWLAYMRAARGMSLSGGGHAALSAGLAEAPLPLVLGAVASALSALLLLYWPIRHLLRSEESPNEYLFDLRQSALLVLVLSALCLGTSWFATRLARVASFAPREEQYALWGAIAAGLLLVTVVAAIIRASSRKAGLPPWRRHALPLLAVVIASTIVAAGIWQSITTYRHIAMGLVGAA